MKSALFLMPILLGRLGTAQPPTTGSESRVAELVGRIGDRKLPGSSRGEALARLAATDFDKAAEVAEDLLSEPDETLRFRAAWILADKGKDAGLEALRTMAADESSELLTAPAALARLRDSKSHQLLREMLQRALKLDTNIGRSRVSALVAALGNYEDPADADLLLPALKKYFSGSNWVLIDSVGRTGAVDAQPALKEIFESTGLDEAIPAAGLALERCGSGDGLRYVQRILMDERKSPTREDTQTRGRYATPAWARRFVLENLGAAADAPLLPDLLGIIREPTSPEALRAYAWTAVLRMNPHSSGDELVALAWRDSPFRSAARFLVLKDEEGTRTAAHNPTRAAAMGLGAASQLSLQAALATPPRERRRWREIHGYPF